LQATLLGKIFSISNLLISCIVSTSRSSFLNDTLQAFSAFLS
uniref:Ovule protein n=1 Tax=Haemonchus placei TaxID=6290 RepID=A0A0N4VZ13_HAEPC